MSVPQGRWVTRIIDLPAIYERLRWTPQDDVFINLFIAAASDTPRELSGDFGEIRPTYELEPDTAAR